MESRQAVHADGYLSPAEEMNPYLPTHFDGDANVMPAFRRSRTFLEAAFIGFGLSFIAPLCNATYCHFNLAMPFSTTIGVILLRMIPVAFCCVIIAIACSVVFPQSISRNLSRHQVSVPVVANSLLYSIYFSMLGFGYVRGGISIFGYYATYYALAPALIAGIGALTHIVVRPRYSSGDHATDGEPWHSHEAPRGVFTN